MGNSVRDRSGPNKSILLECQTDECQNKGFKWRVFYTKIQPGLLSVPALVCQGCAKVPVTIEDIDD